MATKITGRSQVSRRYKHTMYFGIPGQSTTIKFRLPYSHATQKVVLSRTETDVLAGKPGVAAACADALCALAAAANGSAKFPHKVYFAEFTQRAAFIVDKIKNGQPVHCVKYLHNDCTIPMFDRPGGKRALLRSGQATRDIILRPPHKGETRHGRSDPHGKDSGMRSKRPTVARESLKRAIESGLIVDPRNLPAISA